jgi:hypothetical protein
MMLRRIFGTNRDAITGVCRELNNEQLHNFHSSTNVTRIIKLRRMRLAEHEAAECMNNNK